MLFCSHACRAAGRFAVSDLSHAFMFTSHERTPKVLKAATDMNSNSVWIELMCATTYL